LPTPTFFKDDLLFHLAGINLVHHRANAAVLAQFQAQQRSAGEAEKRVAVRVMGLPLHVVPNSAIEGFGDDEVLGIEIGVGAGRSEEAMPELAVDFNNRE
jgi:hypothetical protein